MDPPENRVECSISTEIRFDLPPRETRGPRNSGVTYGKQLRQLRKARRTSASARPTEPVDPAAPTHSGMALPNQDPFQSFAEPLQPAKNPAHSSGTSGYDREPSPPSYPAPKPHLALASTAHPSDQRQPPPPPQRRHPFPRDPPRCRRLPRSTPRPRRPRQSFAHPHPWSNLL